MDFFFIRSRQKFVFFSKSSIKYHLFQKLSPCFRHHPPSQPATGFSLFLFTLSPPPTPHPLLLFPSGFALTCSRTANNQNHIVSMNKGNKDKRAFYSLYRPPQGRVWRWTEPKPQKILSSNYHRPHRHRHPVKESVRGSQNPSIFPNSSPPHPEAAAPQDGISHLNISDLSIFHHLLTNTLNPLVLIGLHLPKVLVGG